ncbi:AEC family transporter [Paraburkholderia bryophila]|uniref:Malonate transporter n=1 Tax=Paraburkholderia bryophila TaxID=420952 RepID=A0A7Y9WUV6_9BURK|nr:AEC family transporter [Paraburkholderia bryophila]NYH27197.1 malonate transporter [Paraburkholderia bryophila]
MLHEISYALVPFFFSMAMGYLAGKLARGAMPLSAINSMLVDYALPFALFLYTAKMQRASLGSHLMLILLLIAVMLVPYFASLALSRFVFNVAPSNAAVRAVTIGMPNFAAIGLPLLHSVYGDESNLTVALAITTASVVMSPAGLILLERAKTRDSGGPHTNLLAKALVTTFVKPIVIAPILGVFVSLAGWELPGLLVQSLGIIGSTTAGLALFSTGLILASQPFRLDREVWAGVALSNIVQPLIALALVVVLALPKQIAGEAILLSAIPCGSFGILFGLSYGVQDTTAGTTLVMSSVLSIVSLTATIFLLGYL